MPTIININGKFGDDVEFTGETIDEAVMEMAVAIVACGMSDDIVCERVAASLTEHVDYEVVE